MAVRGVYRGEKGKAEKGRREEGRGLWREAERENWIEGLSHPFPVVEVPISFNSYW